MNIEFFTNAQTWQLLQYWHQRLYYMKRKTIQQQNVTPLSTEPRTSAIDALLSELLRHVLFVFLFLHHFNLGLFVRTNRTCPYADPIPPK